MTKKKNLPKIEIPEAVVAEEVEIIAEVEEIIEPAPDMLSIYTKFTGDMYDLPEPDNGPYFIATKDGWLTHKKFAFGRAIMPAKENPAVLKSIDTKHKGGLFWHNYDVAPIVPIEIMNKAVSFFRGVYSRLQTEAEVMILLNLSTKEYRLFVPTQVCSGGSVNYTMDTTKVPAGFQLVGTMHSHPVFSAFHSGTDTHDAKTFDGLHITVGQVTDYKRIEFVSMISVNGNNFHKKIEEVADIVGLEDVEVPEWWYTLVSKHSYTGQVIVKGKGGLETKGNKPSWYKGWSAGSNEDSWPSDDPYDGGDYRAWNRNTSFNYTSYCSQIGQNVPKDWMQEGYTGKLKPEKWADAVELVAKKFNEEVERLGLHVEFTVTDTIEESLTDFSKDDSSEAELVGVSTLPTMLNAPVDEVEEYIGE